MPSDTFPIKILFIGDIVGRPGRNALKEWLPEWKAENNIDFVVANGENAAGGMGMTTKIYHELLSLSIDVITTGNHIWSKKEIFSVLDSSDRLLRPANYPENVPGNGWAIHSLRDQDVMIVNLEGRVFMKSLECPFKTIDKILEKFEGKVVLVDFHAEATSEKIALGWYLDGRVSAVVGTHTHVQTADETILPNKTAYISDLGMTGPANSVIGMKKDVVLHRFLTQMPAKFEVAKGQTIISGALVEIDGETGRAVSIERIRVSES
jgi:metallophosphoesterase (TIGR00282 family)